MKKYTITDVHARLVFNCLYTPAIETVVEVNNSYTGSAINPQGQSTGSAEAQEVLDGGRRFGGYGCDQAIKNVNTEIRDLLLGMDVTDQAEVDRRLIELDGTPNKSRLGANAIVSVSAAVARAAANAVGLPLYRYMNNNAHILPVPMLSTMDGGHYGLGAASEIQEFNLFPIGAETMREAVEICREVHFTLGDILEKDYGPMAKLASNAGGYSVPCRSCARTFDYITSAIDACGYSDVIKLGMDCASSHWYNKETKRYHFEGEERSAQEMMKYWKKLVKDYPIISMEDPFDEDDIEGFQMAAAELEGVQIVGDDFFTTNPGRLRERIPMNAGNALLWKYNQIGTITEAFYAAEIAKSNGYGIQASERSGESEDTILSDFAVALNCGQIKTGTLIRTERVSKYNRFLQIEEELGNEAVYAGTFFRKPFMK